MEQVVMPLLKQRNPTARQQAAENLGELARLGEQLRTAAPARRAARSHRPALSARGPPVAGSRRDRRVGWVAC